MAMGFGDAPVTRAMMLASAGSSVLVQAVRVARRPMPTYVAAWERAFVFGHPGELLVGAGLLYYFRLLERQSGTAKFGGRALATSCLSHLLVAAVKTGLGWRAASGPYGLLFSCFVPFALEVPPLQRFTLCGLRLTDKVFIYCAGLQLLLSSPRLSAPAGFSGIIAGMLYQLNLFGMKRLKLPRWACALFGQPAVRRPVVRHINMMRTPGQHQAQQQRQQRRGPRAGQRQPLPEPSPESLAQLAAMGFDDARAAQALQQTGNDVNAAIALLI